MMPSTQPFLNNHHLSFEEMLAFQADLFYLYSSLQV